MINQQQTEFTTQFYTWQNYRCAYTVDQPTNSTPSGIPLLLIHPIGVGLSRQFWQRFCHEWRHQQQRNLIYNPDLLGCGESDQPHIAYHPSDWAGQLQYFLQTVVQKPVIVVVQGALFAVAIELVNREPNLVAGLVLASPPAWPLITKELPKWQAKWIWNLLDSPFGNVFYRYARREKFLRDFSTKQLFDSPEDVDSEWLNTLCLGAENTTSRYAVFSFLAGFWLKDYSSAIAAINQPTLVVLGENISSIAKEGKKLEPDAWLSDYLAALPQGRGIKIPGRNVLPYESTAEFVKAISPFMNEFS
ncbi:alpha/beta fold hydrolase [Pelatocladus sp. BLCC-F211]|uniref:alpha/beta fold hydrolase n=1 Tax=Pelatocladus sp. BLCC-F211 TaxID=3342752 RepID=UPI0035B6F099